MPSEMDDESAKIFPVGLWRPKTLMRQDISIFPQKRHMLRDWYFNFAYYLVMADSTTSKYLFPTMAEKAGAELDGFWSNVKMEGLHEHRRFIYPELIHLI